MQLLGSSARPGEHRVAVEVEKAMIYAEKLQILY